MYSFNHALITGISGDLGFALASYLITHNLCKNLSVCARGEVNDTKLQALCDKFNVVLNIEHFDIRDDALLKDFIYKANNLAKLDLVIANAGVSLTRSGKDNLLEDDFEINRGFDINTKASIKTIYYALSSFIEESATINNNLHLVTISSLASMLPMRSSPVYSASKAALNMYIVALEQMINTKYKNRVFFTNVLAGFIKSNMSDRYIGKKSFMIDASTASDIIIKAVIKRKSIVAFPFSLYFLLKLVPFVPRFISSFFINKFDFEVKADKDRVSFEKDSNN